MKICVGVYCLLLIPCAWAQLELPFVEEEPEATPTPSAEQLEEEQERIREITREMQRNEQMGSVVISSPPHPGQVHFARVYERLLKAPETVRLRVTLNDGSSTGGQMENRLLDLKTPQGTFPIQWSELLTLQSTESGRQVTLVTGEVLSGTLEELLLQVERNDASFIRIPLSSVQEISILQRPR